MTEKEREKRSIHLLAKLTKRFVPNNIIDNIICFYFSDRGVIKGCLRSSLGLFSASCAKHVHFLLINLHVTNSFAAGGTINRESIRRALREIDEGFSVGNLIN